MGGGSRAARTGWESNRGGRQERSVCLSTGLAGYGQGCCPRIVELQHQKSAKKDPKIWKFARKFGFLGTWIEVLSGLGRFVWVSRRFFMRG